MDSKSLVFAICCLYAGGMVTIAIEIGVSDLSVWAVDDAIVGRQITGCARNGVYLRHVSTLLNEFVVD